MGTFPKSNLVETLRNTEAGAVAAIVDEHCHAHLHQFEKLGVPIIVLPRTGEVKSLESLLDTPRRARATVNVRDEKSFLDYVKRHRGPGTVIFAEITEAGGSFTAILDYHQPNPEPVEGQPAQTIVAPQWGEHVCKYVCEFTPEWKRWIEESGELLTQTDLALFIEDNVEDIVDPVGAKMLEIVKTLEATQGAQFRSAIRLDNNDRSFGYTVQTGAKAGEKGDLEIPQKFTLEFPIFTNGDGYKIECRFRWSVEGGNLRLGFEIVKPHKLIEAALLTAQQSIAAELKLPVLLGSGQVLKA